MFGVPILAIVVLGIICFSNGEFMSGNERYAYIKTFVTEITDETAAEGSAFPDLMPNGDTSNLPMHGEAEAYKKVEVLMSSQESIGSQFEIGTDFTSQSINGELCYVEELEPISMWR